MAAADYKLCDICGSKTFYDSDLDYEYGVSKEDSVDGKNYSLQHTGDWKVICKECSKTWKCVVIRRN